MMRFFLCSILLTLSQLTVAQPTSVNNIVETADTKQLVFSTFNAYTLSQTVSAILKKAYQKIGIGISIKYLPGKRALFSSNAGIVDGELFRIAGIQKKYPNLLQVVEPVLELKTTAYSSSVTFPVDGWQSLKPYKLGFLRGFRKAELNTKSMDTYMDDSLSNLFKLLDKGRIDLVIESKLGASVILFQNNYPKVKALSPSVDSFTIHHYVHLKHQKLLKPLNAVLVEMRQSGEIEQIINTTIQSIAQAALDSAE